MHQNQFSNMLMLSQGKTLHITGFLKNGCCLVTNPSLAGQPLTSNSINTRKIKAGYCTCLSILQSTKAGKCGDQRSAGARKREPAALCMYCVAHENVALVPTAAASHRQ